MPKNLGSISHPKDIITLEYLEGNYTPLSKTPKLVVGTTVTNSVTSIISIPSTIVDRDNMVVYQNGVFLNRGMQYSVSENVISLIDYTSDINDVFTFLCIG